MIMDYLYVDWESFIVDVFVLFYLFIYFFYKENKKNWFWGKEKRKEWRKGVWKGNGLGDMNVKSNHWGEVLLNKFKGEKDFERRRKKKKGNKIK